ncbi:MAG: T9SS type A sorting domain-containing protein [Bacteroidetes bacterium]|nr:T9SS type A sorting domain-containing protein [Bacteroidota bacterium]
MSIRLFYIFLVCFSVFYSHSQNIYTYAGTGIAGYSGDNGPAISAQIYLSADITTDSFGNVYFCDNANNRVRKIDPSGNISTIAGGGSSLAEGIPATSATIIEPHGIAVDASGNIYVSEVYLARVRKINTSGIINTIAGNGNVGYAGDGGPAISAELKWPYDVAVDASGNIYIADAGNNRIRMINTLGVISTIAGNGLAGYSGDGGPATSAQLNSASGIDVDPLGNIFIADRFNGRIRKINSSGTISTIAGSGVMGNSGDGGLATLAQIGSPNGVTLDAAGNIYIADGWYGTLRKINTSNIISTIAGTGIPGYSGDGGLATLAQIKTSYLTIGTTGNVFLSDGGNDRIREICFNACSIGITESKLENEVKLFPIPANNYISLETGNINIENSQIEITNMLGERVLSSTYTNHIDVGSISEGIYNLQIVSSEAIITKKIVIQH